MSSILDALRKLEAAKKASQKHHSLSPLLLEERVRKPAIPPGPLKEFPLLAMKGLPLGLLMAFLALVAGLFYGLGYLSKGESKPLEVATIAPPSPPASLAPQPSAPVTSQLQEEPKPLPTRHVVKIQMPEESQAPREDKPQPSPVPPRASISKEAPYLNTHLHTFEAKEPSPEKEVEVKAPLPESGDTLDANLLGSTVSSSQDSTLEEPIKEEDLDLSNPLSPEDAPFPDLKINAISLQGDTPGAIVNMKKVYEGDTIAGAKVITINPDNIFFQYQGRIVKVRF